VLATPHDVHCDQTVACLEAGKHVVVDKIMGASAEEADRMIAARDASGKVLSVFHNRRWDGDFLTVKRIQENGLIGPFFRIEAGVMRYGKPGGWRAQKARGGGMLSDWGAHMADQAVQFFGHDVAGVYCAQQHRVWDTDVETHSLTVIQFAEGQTYSIELSNISRQTKPRWRVIGEKGSLTKTGLDPQERAMIDGDIDAAEEAPKHYAQVVTDVDGFEVDMTVPTTPGRWRSYYENISAVLNEGADLAVRPEDVRTSVAILEAAHQSAHSGQVVKPK
jgi:predicted dehydrogenase